MLLSPNYTIQTVHVHIWTRMPFNVCMCICLYLACEAIKQSLGASLYKKACPQRTKGGKHLWFVSKNKHVQKLISSPKWNVHMLRKDDESMRQHWCESASSNKIHFSASCFLPQHPPYKITFRSYKCSSKNLFMYDQPI